ncbi:MAG: YjfB family protein [Planctomycetes bacterium]|nr:YjfB family protein [Planctomycetota bacterium]
MMPDISAQAIGILQQTRLLQSVQILVAKKSLDAIEQQGEAVIQLMEVAADLARQPGIPQATRGIDLSS